MLRIRRQQTAPMHRRAMTGNSAHPTPAEDLLTRVTRGYSPFLADPICQFRNRTGKLAPEYKRLLRSPTTQLKEFMDLPVAQPGGLMAADGEGNLQTGIS